MTHCAWASCHTYKGFCVPWLIRMCDMTPFWHTYMRHDSLRLSGMSHMWRSPVTCINESHHRYETVEICGRHSCVPWYHNGVDTYAWHVPCIALTHWMSHVPHKWVMSHIKWVMSHMNESYVTWLMSCIVLTHLCDMTQCAWAACHTYEGVMSHIWRSHVACVYESCHRYERVTSHVAHIRMRHDTHVNEACHTYEGVMSHLWMSHGTHMNESCHTYEGVMSRTYEWVMARMWMIHVTHMNESCRTHTNESCGVATISRLLKMIGLFRRI